LASFSGYFILASTWIIQKLLRDIV
jgi:hypothetical protein